MKALSVAVSLVAVSFYMATASAVDLNDAKEQQYWKDVTFSVAQAGRMVFDSRSDKSGGANQNCYVSAENFAGCVHAIQALGAQVNPTETLIPNTYLTQSDWKNVQVLQKLSTMSLVKGSRDLSSFDAMTPEQKVADIQQEETDLTNLGQDAIKSKTATGKLPIDFHALANVIYASRPADVPEGKLAVALASGFTQTLDPHSHFDLTKQLYDQSQDADTSLTGIGLPMTEQDGHATVAANPLSGSPAEKAGMKVGDVITEVDGQNVLNVPLAKVVNLIRGKVDTTVRLQVQRDDASFTLDLVRAKIVQKNVDDRVVDDISDRKIGYISLGDFEDSKGCDAIKADILSLESSDNVQGYILDLRNNGGGFLDQAICIGSLFAGKQPIVYTKNLSTNQVITSDGTADAVTVKPMTVLINGGSASASEIVSGALQGLERAFLVGVRSFGKATVQSGEPFILDPNIMYFHTTARFYVPYETPSGALDMRTNQRIGVKPDFAVPFKPGATPDEQFTMREADEFPNSLTAETKTWAELRPTQVAQIQTCLDSGKRADAVYARAPGQDYQLLKAEEVLACEANQ